MTAISSGRAHPISNVRLPSSRFLHGSGWPSVTEIRGAPLNRSHVYRTNLPESHQEIGSRPVPAVGTGSLIRGEASRMALRSLVQNHCFRDALFVCRKVASVSRFVAYNHMHSTEKPMRHLRPHVLATQVKVRSGFCSACSDSASLVSSIVHFSSGSSPEPSLSSSICTTVFDHTVTIYNAPLT